MSRACYNPTEAPKLWQRMAEAQHERVPDGKTSTVHLSEFVSTHPSYGPVLCCNCLELMSVCVRHERRFRDLQGWMDEAMTERNKHCAHLHRSGYM